MINWATEVADVAPILLRLVRINRGAKNQTIPGGLRPTVVMIRLLRRRRANRPARRRQTHCWTGWTDLTERQYSLSWPLSQPWRASLQTPVLDSSLFSGRRLLLC